MVLKYFSVGMVSLSVLLLMFLSRYNEHYQREMMTYYSEIFKFVQRLFVRTALFIARTLSQWGSFVTDARRK